MHSKEHPRRNLSQRESWDISQLEACKDHTKSPHKSNREAVEEEIQSLPHWRFNSIKVLLAISAYAKESRQQIRVLFFRVDRKTDLKSTLNGNHQQKRVCTEPMNPTVELPHMDCSTDCRHLAWPGTWTAVHIASELNYWGNANNQTEDMVQEIPASVPGPCNSNPILKPVSLVSSSLPGCY